MSAALVHHQARLWLTAFVVSGLLNVAVLIGIFGLHLFNPVVLAAPSVPPPPPAETVVTILAELAAPPAEEAGATPAAPSPKEDPSKGFARTSPLQAEEAPEQAAHIGERNTRATSNADPVAEAPALPSQKGREPDFEGDLETTQSRYQEGEMGPVRPPTAPAMPAMPPPGAPLGSELAENDTEPQPQPPATPVPAPEIPPEPAPTAETPPALPVPPPAPAETLAQGPSPVDIPVKRPEKPAPDSPKAQVEPPAKPKESAKATAKKGEEGPKAAPAAKSDNSFQGNQQKTRILGSISRKGESALDVEDTALGRYQAQLSRAVERQWQLNCVRNRDYITPGMLRVRFVIEPSGKVRSLGFVEEFGVGNIQKGFTLSSIREAAIPAMPADVKKELKGEALEIIYNFIF